jgi:thiopurine S-methyltransferase
MDPAFWLERWERNEIGFHQPEINTHLQEFWPRLGLPADSRVFVPLCGKSRDLLWLSARGHRVTGVEISPIAVADFFAEHRLTPHRERLGGFERYSVDTLEILQGDFFDLAPEHLESVAGIYDRASLIALPETLRTRYAEHLSRLVPADADILLVTMRYPQHEMSGPPFAVSAAEVATLYAGRYRIEALYQADILAENPRFRERGLSSLVEQVFHLRPPGDGSL